MKSNEILTLLEARAAKAIRTGRRQEAIEHYSAILSMDGGHVEALEFMAAHARQNNDLAAAEAFHARLALALPASLEVRYNHAMAALQAGSLLQAVDALKACMRIDAGFYPALIYQGLALEKMGDIAAATAAFLQGIRIAETRPRNSMAPDLLQLLQRASLSVRRNLGAAIDAALAPMERQLGPQALARIRHCADIFIGKRALEPGHPLWRPGLAYIPDLPVRPFLERRDLPWLHALEQQTPVILDELLAVMASGEGLAPYIDHPPNSAQAAQWRALNRSSKWSSYHFFRHGVKNEPNCARCPRTTALLESLDLMRVPGYGPEAMFSILLPGTEIKPHYGSINGRLIVHLPLIVPQNCGGLRVAGETREWVQGQCLVFDDSFEHSAWNHSDRTRVVLILDAWNPALSLAERDGFSALLQTAREFESRHLAAPAAQ